MDQNARSGHGEVGAAQPVGTPVATPALAVVRGPVCEGCGGEGTIGGAVDATTGSAMGQGTRPPALCERCRRHQSAIIAVQTAISWMVFFAGLFYVLPHLLASAPGTVQYLEGNARTLRGGALLAFYGSMFVGVIFHEGAHALCARAFRSTVTGVRIGSGPTVLRCTLGRTTFALHIWPFGGLTTWVPGTSAMTPRRRAAVAFAGPLANLLLAGFCWAVRSSNPELAIPAACANLIIFIQNIFPHPGGEGRGQGNDGWQVLTNLTRPHLAHARARSAELLGRCTALAQDGRNAEAAHYLRSELEKAGGDNPDAEALLCVYLLSTDRTQEEIAEGFERSGRLLYDQRATPALRAMALSNRAWMLAVGGWPDRLAEAEWEAREALRALPDNAGSLGPMALILVRQGRFAEAEPLAEKVIRQRVNALAKAKGPRRAEVARLLACARCTRGLLYTYTGRLEAARGEIAATRSLDADCPLLAELERMHAPSPGFA